MYLRRSKISDFCKFLVHPFELNHPTLHDSNNTIKIKRFMSCKIIGPYRKFSLSCMTYEKPLTLRNLIKLNINYKKSGMNEQLSYGYQMITLK